MQKQKKDFIYADYIKGPRNNIFKEFLNNRFLNINKNQSGIFKMKTSNKIKYLEIYEKNR